MSQPAASQSQADRMEPARPAALKRTLGLWLLVAYGLGVTVGAGIYVLIGAAAGRAGQHAPVAFLIAAVIMTLTALSMAELARRMPVSAGEAAFVQAGFRSQHLALFVGLLVTAAGVVSAAAISRGTAGYLGVLVPAREELLVTGVVVAMGLLAAWGISQAVGLAALITVIEVGGLLVIVGAGLWQRPEVITRLPDVWTGLGETTPWPGILGASLLAFFAFIGFESIVNVAEETTEPERTLPRAIMLTIVISTVLYIAVVWVVINAVPRAELAQSDAPLSLAYQRLTGAPPTLITAIAIFATINGVIVQLVMSSRVIYGLARQGVLPTVLGRVNPVTRTPLPATLLVVAITLALALGAPIERLAEMSTRVTLVIFTLVNASLVMLRLRGAEAGAGFRVPIWVPVLGALSCLGLLGADLAR